MTCIVGYEHKGKVWIGGDSAGVGGLAISVRADRKVFKNKQFIMGFTSSFRMGQLLQYRFKPPPITKGMNLEEYMCTKFVDGVRNCFNKYNFGHSGDDGDHGGTFLIGVRGRLFRIDSDYQVGWNALPYDSVGCGYHLALGAMHAFENIDSKCKDYAPDFRIEQALLAAAASSAGVCAPFHIVKK